MTMVTRSHVHTEKELPTRQGAQNRKSVKTLSPTTQDVPVEGVLTNTDTQQIMETATIDSNRTSREEEITHIRESNVRNLTKENQSPLVCRNSWATVQGGDEEYRESENDVVLREEARLMSESWETRAMRS